MLAELLAPFAKWGAIVGAVLLGWWFAARRHRQGIMAEDDLEEFADAERDRQRQAKTTRALGRRARAAARRGWLRGRGDS